MAQKTFFSPVAYWILWTICSAVFFVPGMVVADETAETLLERRMPDTYVPGLPFVVELEVSPEAQITSFAIEETVPSGWMVRNVTERVPARFSKTGIGWLHIGSERVVFKYEAVPPSDASGPADFSAKIVTNLGEIIVNAGEIAISSEDSPIEPETPELVGWTFGERNLPDRFVPGERMRVGLKIFPGEQVEFFEVEERLPDGWQVLNASVADQRATVRGNEIAWWIRGNEPQTLFYDVLPPTDAIEPVRFSAWIVTSADTAVIHSDEIAPDLDALPEEPVPEPSGDTGERKLPEVYYPGESFVVELEVRLGKTGSILLIEERIPAGWTVGNISGGGRSVPDRNAIRWMKLYPEARSTFTYEVTPPIEASGAAEFSGRILVDADQSALETEEIEGAGFPISGSFSIASGASGGEGDEMVKLVVTRQMPSTFVPGQSFEVSLLASVAPEVFEYEIHERVPAGWGASQIGDGGFFDAVENAIVWRFRGDLREREVKYTVHPPLTQKSAAEFSGSAIVRELAIRGDSSISAKP